MMRRIKDLNEEVSRWAFEILFRQNKKWKIAFTNPTAGPWKTIKGLDSEGVEGEVYRFPLEETRPDIILYNDDLEAVLIFEAKDSLNKLVTGNQAEKSVDVVERLSEILSKLSGNKYWGKRAQYPIYLGLLWGSSDTLSSQTAYLSVFDTYYNLARTKTKLNIDFVIGVESLYKSETIVCHFHHKTYADDQEARCQAVEASLK